VVGPVETGVTEGDLAQLADRVRPAAGHDEVPRVVELEHAPHRLDVVGGAAPVAAGVEVAESQLVVEPELDAGDAVAHLAFDELESPAGRAVVEQDPRGGEHVVALAVVDRDPVCVDLGHAVGRAGMERCAFGLGHLHHLAEHLRRAGLVEADVGVDVADRLQHPHRAEGGDVPGEDGLGEAGEDEALRGQVVDLAGPMLGDDRDQ
jgi:hypothetical protein